MTKQSKSPKNVPANANDGETREKNLFVKIDTFNTKGENVGNRIVDMYHFGTRNWLQSHTWWAMHNGHNVVTQIATTAEVEAHTQAQIEALAAKFNEDKAHKAA